MKFRVSTNTAVFTDDVAGAKQFYGEVLGLPFRETSDGPIVDAGHLQMFIDQQNLSDGIVLELVVDDVEAARELLEQNGCTVLHWEGAGKACFIEDPFGVRFNLWQD